MTDFEFFAPTKVVFGKDKELLAGKLLKEQGAKKVLIVYGMGSAKKTGLLDKVEKSLEAEGISYAELSGAQPNPLLSKVYEGIEVAKRENADFLLAVGGGSVIDTAKAIAYGAANDGDVWDFYCGKRKPKKALPVGTIVTIAASGSEMSSSSVITKDEGLLKRGTNSDLSRPRFSIMNPELTYTLPAYQTACGATDIIMHTLERYFNNELKTMALTDRIGEELIKTVIESAKVLLKNPKDYDARANLMWAGSLSHNDLTGCANGVKDWSCHKLEHELGGMFNVAHGAGLAAIWPSWARYVYRVNPKRFASLAENIMGVPKDFGNNEEKALEGIRRMEKFFEEIGMPTKISGLGVKLTEENIEELAYKCSNGKNTTIGSLKVLTFEDMKNIYRLAK